MSHAGFLRTSVAHANFSNADYRIGDLKKVDGVVEFVEWEETEKKGGGMGKSVRGRADIVASDFP